MSKLTATTAMLMTPEEKALFRASESRSLHKVGDPELRTQIERARHLRKKYGDLLQRERSVAQREGVDPESRAAIGNPATVRKSTAFTYVVEQFEAERDRRAGSIAPAVSSTASKAESGKSSSASRKKAPQRASGAKKTASGAKPTVAKASGRGSKAETAVGGKLESKRDASRAISGKKARGGLPVGALRGKPDAQRQEVGPAQRQVGHAAARGRRLQARRDSRG